MEAAEFESVLRGAREGSGWAWSKVYAWLAADLRGYLRARGAEDVDDAVGDVFLQLARNVARFEGDAASFRSWTFLVGHHRIIDQARKRKRDRTVATDPHTLPAGLSPLSVEAEVLASMSAEEIRAWLERHLTRDQLDVVLLSVFGGFTAAEVAEALSKQPGAVRVARHRALAVLRRVLASGGVTK